MRVDFTKMHGLGNDFIVFHAAPGTELPAARWRALADRHRGIGFDQALVIEPPRSHGTSAFYRIFNADGHEVEQCGNGARCIAELLRLEGRAANGSIVMESPGGVVRARLPVAGTVAIDMGVPDFSPAAVAFDDAGESGPHYRIDVGGDTVDCAIVSMGNPHTVLAVDSVATAPVARLGPLLEAHPRFRRRVNVGFREIVGRSLMRLRVFERGVGETQACGTGACAAVATGRRDGLLDAEVRVSLPGGDLTIRWEGGQAPLWLEGPAEVSFRGQVDL
jgi:diaminopimelate epimerase